MIVKHGERIVSRGTYEVSPGRESLVLSTADHVSSSSGCSRDAA